MKQRNTLYIILLCALMGNLIPIPGNANGFILLTKLHDDELEAEKNLSALKDVLLPKKFTEYYCCDDEIRVNGERQIDLGVLTGLRRFYIAQYVLSPAILVYKSKEKQAELCVCLASDVKEMNDFCQRENLILEKNFGNGVYLLRHKD